MQTDIKNFRRTLSLSSGVQVLLCILTPADREHLIEMFQCATDADLEFFRDDVRDAGLVARWAEHVNLKHVVPVVALVQDRIVGEGMLQLGRGCDRHMAELRIYLCREFRGRGLGSAMIKALIDLGREMGLRIVFARIAASQTQVVRAFQSLGFEVEHTSRDRLINSAGETQDVVEVVYYVRRASAF
ncbi:MAG: GNAT family N-acetyltransferase [Thermoflexales bacterium]|nr:GNAT family N-acetyltransferase [Thermoflexales bacterium]